MLRMLTQWLYTVQYKHIQICTQKRHDECIPMKGMKKQHSIGETEQRIERERGRGDVGISFRIHTAILLYSVVHLLHRDTLNEQSKYRNTHSADDYFVFVLKILWWNVSHTQRAITHRHTVHIRYIHCQAYEHIAAWRNGIVRLSLFLFVFLICLLLRLVVSNSLFQSVILWNNSIVLIVVFSIKIT